MDKKHFETLADMSTVVGRKPDITQGGGGNTSVKLDDHLMAVKASGCRLSDMTPQKGFVVVNYAAISEYIAQVDFSSGIDYEKDSVDFVRRNIVEVDGVETMRPSVEAPFHSFLKKYVIHTHSVYANILCCAKEGRMIAGKLFKREQFLWIPYVNPGFLLSIQIRHALIRHQQEFHGYPKIIFMQNHGLIVTEDTAEDCMKLNDEVNNTIIRYFCLSESYPTPGIEKVGDHLYRSESPFIAQYFNPNNANFDYFDQNALYPDQLVYLNSSFCREPKKISMDEHGRALYHTNAKEAISMEETLAAYLYVVNTIHQCELTMSVMNDEQKNFIYNWELEKYRLKQMS